MKIISSGQAYELCPSMGESITVKYDPNGWNSAGNANEYAVLTIGTLSLPNGRMGLIIQYLDTIYENENGKAVCVLDDPNGADEIVIQGLHLKRREGQ